MSGIIAQNSGRHTGLVKASSGGGGVWNLIETLTSDGSDSDLSFTSGIDSTYDEYVFKFINIHPSADEAGVNFGFNLSIDSGSNYNVTKTSTHFRAYHHETSGATALEYDSALHLAQSTSVQLIAENLGADNDQSCGGTLHLFSPSSTVFAKHYIASFNVVTHADYCVKHHVGGYGNTTSAIDAIQFSMSSGNIDAGTISLYGIS